MLYILRQFSGYALTMTKTSDFTDQPRLHKTMVQSACADDIFCWRSYWWIRDQHHFGYVSSYIAVNDK